MDQTRIRRVNIVRHKSGNAAVAAGVATWTAGFRGRVVEVEMSLNTTGGTSGNTDTDVKKNGTTIMAANALRIVQGSATKFVRATPDPAKVSGHPSGVAFDVGDVFTFDIVAIPGTASADVTWDLLVVPNDVG
jgi:hypothetical protein